MTKMRGNNERPPDANRKPVWVAPKWAAYLVGPMFFGLAAWLVWGPDYAEIPSAKGASFDKEVLSTGPRRRVLGDPPALDIGGYHRTCMDCHRFIPPAVNPPEKLMQHTHIVLNHGLNERCRNCHYVGDRDMLTLRDGTPIGFAEVARLCAQCHGPTYRDWQRGSHGRTNGYWDASRGPSRRLGCTECHEPHNPQHPAMDPLEPLPPPVTLRMGEPLHHAKEEMVENDPLRRPLGVGDDGPDAATQPHSSVPEGEADHE